MRPATYYLVLTDADLDQADAAPYKYRLDIDFLSVLATDPKSARPLDGEYTIGKSTDNKAGVFIEGFLGTDSFGMPALFGIYWNEPDEEEGSTTPHAIVGGKMRIKTDKGITTIKAEFIDEDDQHAARQLPRSARIRKPHKRLLPRRLETECRLCDERRRAGGFDQEDHGRMYGPVRPLGPALLRKGVLRDAGRGRDTTSGSGENGSGAGIHSVGTYKATSDDTPGFLPGTREDLGGGNLRAVNTWFYSGRTPHAPMTNGSLTLKTSNGTDYEVSFSTGDDHPMPYLVTGSFSGTVKKLASN